MKVKFKEIIILQLKLFDFDPIFPGTRLCAVNSIAFCCLLQVTFNLIKFKFEFKWSWWFSIIFINIKRGIVAEKHSWEEAEKY